MRFPLFCSLLRWCTWALACAVLALWAVCPLSPQRAWVTPWVWSEWQVALLLLWVSWSPPPSSWAKWALPWPWVALPVSEIVCACACVWCSAVKTDILGSHVPLKFPNIQISVCQCVNGWVSELPVSSGNGHQVMSHTRHSGGVFVASHI